MSEWINPKDRLPEQGKKVLFWRKGDCWIAQRFGEYWFPIPFTDSKFAESTPPEKWSEIDFPDGFTGKLRIMPEDVERLMDMDEFEEHDKEQFDKFVNAIAQSMVKKDE